MQARLLALGGAALVCAACGSNAAAAHTTPGSWLVQTSGRPATATAAPQAAGTQDPGAAVLPGSGLHPTAAPSGHGGAPVRPATASAPPAAAPGVYPVSGSYSGSSSTQATPSSTSGAGTLTISSPQATAAGSEEDETYRFGSQSLTTHDVFGDGGAVQVTRSGDATFSPPLPMVPAGLHDGMSWGPVSFTSGGASGTLSGSSGTTTHATVDGVAVTIVPITLHLTLHGSFHGTPYTATSDEYLDWAPSLHLPVHMRMVTDAQYAGTGKYHSELDLSLLSTHPQ